MAKTAPARRALGRGLTNLIPTHTDESTPEHEVVEVELGAIHNNPFQPRITFNEAEIDGLAESIQSQGLLQPILLRKRAAGGYEIISGERRFRAMKKLGFDKAPAIVRPATTDREMLEMAIVENIQRADLNGIEEAVAYQKLLLECGLSHEDLSRRMGKSRSAVTNILRLLKLPTEVQDMVRSGAISAGHARAILSIDDPVKQKELAERIVLQKLSVRDIEQTTKEESPAKNKKPVAKAVVVDPDQKSVEEKLQYKFGTPVRIVKNGAEKGAVTIEFYSNADLNRVIDLLL